MNAASKGATFVYAAASLAFALIGPAAARALVAVLLVSGTVLVAWSSQHRDVLLGQVVETVTDDQGRVFAAVRPLPGGDEVGLVIPTVTGSDAATPFAGDLVLAFRSGSKPTGVFEAGHAAILPASTAIAAYEDFDLAGTIARTNDLGIALSAILIVLFAVVLLRVGIGLLFAPIALGTIWLLLGYNAGSWALAPIPAAMIEPLTLCAGAVGGVLAFKSTLRDPTRLGLRIAAAALVVPLMAVAGATGLVPAALGQGLPLLAPMLAAMFWPIVVPVLAATMLVRQGLELDLAMTGAVFLGLLLLRWPVFARFAGRTGATTSSPVQLSPDATGEISLDALLRGRKET